MKGRFHIFGEYHHSHINPFEGELNVDESDLVTGTFCIPHTAQDYWLLGVVRHEEGFADLRFVASLPNVPEPSLYLHLWRETSDGSFEGAFRGCWSRRMFKENHPSGIISEMRRTALQPRHNNLASATVDKIVTAEHQIVR